MDLDGIRAPFFVGGAKQCGTTWLYHVFREHPDMWLPPVKELHCYTSPEAFHAWRVRVLDCLAGRGDPTFRKNVRPSVSDCDRRFLDVYATLSSSAPQEILTHCRALAGPRRCGDVDPNLLSLETSRIVALVSAVGPDAQFFFIARNPVQRHWSGFKKKMRKAGVSKLEDMVEPFMRILPTAPMTYLPNLPRWREVCGSGIVLLDYDDLSDNPAHVLRTIALRLGIADCWKIPRERINVGPVLAMPERLRRLAEEHFAPDLAFLRTEGLRDLRL
jgi:hypothetical protein